MEKDFDKWNLEKKRLHSMGLRKSAHQRDVWWCALGLNLGSEEDGKGWNYLRPVLILKSFGNVVCTILPISTSNKEHWTKIDIGLINSRPSKILLNQIRSVDTRRLIRKICRLDNSKYEEIRKAVRDIF